MTSGASARSLGLPRKRRRCRNAATMQGRQARRACQQARPGILRTRKKHALQLTCLNGQLTATAAAYFLLFTSSSLTTALPAAVATGRFGSMSLVIPQTAMQRVIPNAVLGRVSAAFLAGEAAAILAGAVAGPFLAH